MIYRMDGDARALLREVVERIESLEEEKKATSARIAEAYAHAKAGGLSVATVRMVVRRRRSSPADLAEAQAMLDLYEDALPWPFAVTAIAEAAE